MPYTSDVDPDTLIGCSFCNDQSQKLTLFFFNYVLPSSQMDRILIQDPNISKILLNKLPHEIFCLFGIISKYHASPKSATASTTKQVRYRQQTWQYCFTAFHGHSWPRRRRIILHTPSQGQKVLKRAANRKSAYSSCKRKKSKCIEELHEENNDSPKGSDS
jgi:hypothetical protein